MLEEKCVSVHHSIAEYYWLDARDFLSRFDVLWEIEMHKTGRIKSFIDLLMACECVLKSHVMLGLKDFCPKVAYHKLRRASHKISDLADAARLNKNRVDYNFLKSELSEFKVNFRYSLDAYDKFFPLLGGCGVENIKYSETIGCHVWVMSIRDAIDRLINDLSPDLTGFVPNDLDAIFENDRGVKLVIDEYECKCRKISSKDIICKWCGMKDI